MEDDVRTKEKLQKLTESELRMYELIKQRRLQILVHSCIYYEFNRNIISDKQYDMLSKELAELQKAYPKLSKIGPLYKQFRHFDGSTGFFLRYDRGIKAKAEYLLELQRRRALDRALLGGSL